MRAILIERTRDADDLRDKLALLRLVLRDRLLIFNSKVLELTRREEHPSFLRGDFDVLFREMLVILSTRSQLSATSTDDCAYILGYPEAVSMNG